MVESKVASKCYAVYSAYRPTKDHHRINDALLRRSYRTIGGISQHAKVEALFAPQEGSSMGLTDATTRYVEGVQQEGTCNMCRPI